MGRLALSTFIVLTCTGISRAQPAVVQGTDQLPSAGLLLSLRADAGVATSAGGVYQWADQSGSNAPATQSSSANRPAFVPNCAGAPCVRFDGFESFLNLSLPTTGLKGMTILLVSTSNMDVPANSKSSLISWRSTGQSVATFLSPLQRSLQFGFGDGQTSPPSPYLRPASIGNRVTVTTAIKNAAEEAFYVDGTLQSESKDNPVALTGMSSQAFLGRSPAGAYFAGDLYQIVVYNYALPDSDRASAERYLINKYETAPLQNAVNVKTLGAKGDGQADDTSAIQAAITSAANNGGTVYFPAGTYNYSNVVISGKTNLTMLGQNATLITIGSPLTSVDVIGSPGLTISGLIFDYNFRNGYLFDVTSPNVTFVGNTFKNVGDGSYPNPEVGLYIAPGSNNLLIQGNTLSNFRSGPNGSVRGIYIGNYRNAALASAGARIIGNYFDTILPPHDADAVVIDQQGLSSSALIAYNSFYNSSKRAVKLMSNSNTVIGNSITVDNIGTQSYSAVSSYGDSNLIAQNTALAQGCSQGCSFYAAWELSGNGNTLTNNVAQNPSTTTDTDIDCVYVTLPSGYSSLSNITISGNTCSTFRYVRFYTNTPTKNLTITSNTLLDARKGTAIVFYPGSTTDGLTLTSNATDSKAQLASFENTGASGKSKFTVGPNTGLIDFNLLNDPVPKTFNVNTPLVPQGGVTVHQITSGRKVGQGTLPPNAGFWKIGDVVYTTPSSSATSSIASVKASTGWICIVAGTPGVWKKIAQ